MRLRRDTGRSDVHVMSDRSTASHGTFLTIVQATECNLKHHISWDASGAWLGSGLWLGLGLELELELELGLGLGFGETFSEFASNPCLLRISTSSLQE